jgi:hypothetical protein
VQAASLHEFSEFIFADAHTNQFNNKLGDWHFLSSNYVPYTQINIIQYSIVSLIQLVEHLEMYSK